MWLWSKTEQTREQSHCGLSVSVTATPPHASEGNLMSGNIRLTTAEFPSTISYLISGPLYEMMDNLSLRMYDHGAVENRLTSARGDWWLNKSTLVSVETGARRVLWNTWPLHLRQILFRHPSAHAPFSWAKIGACLLVRTFARTNSTQSKVSSRWDAGDFGLTNWRFCVSWCVLLAWFEWCVCGLSWCLLWSTWWTENNH